GLDLDAGVHVEGDHVGLDQVAARRKRESGRRACARGALARREARGAPRAGDLDAGAGVAERGLAIVGYADEVARDRVAEALVEADAGLGHGAHDVAAADVDRVRAVDTDADVLRDV